MMTSVRPRSSLLAELLRRIQLLAASLWPFATHSTGLSKPRALVVVEGPNDIEFLRRISAILHRDDPRVPDLADLERRFALVFVPSGGSDSSAAIRFAGLQLPEFHLLDRDLPPATEARERVAAMVNSRSNCRAVLTSKRSLENYLHSDAIFEASGISVAVSDEENVPDLIARSTYERHEPSAPWDQLPPRARKRLHNKVKRWLNTRAVERMTPERLAERDQAGEVRNWLITIAGLLES